MSCGDMHQSFTDAFVLRFYHTIAYKVFFIVEQLATALLKNSTTLSGPGGIVTSALFTIIADPMRVR